MCGFQEVDSYASTKPLSDGDSVEARLEGEVASLEEMFPMDHEVAPEPSLVSWFDTAQLEDPNLASALQQVTTVDVTAVFL
jgi:hypothetical protein